MFSERKVLEKLARFKAKYGWLPVEHSVEEVERVNVRFRELCTTGPNGDVYFDDDNWNSKLRRWVENERAMCAISCSYFLTRYYFISADNQIQRFTFRSGQKAFFRVLQELEGKGQSIEIQCLKARQQGISTLIEGIMTWFALFVSGSKCSIGSADDQKTYVMMGMMYTALEHIPWWLPPTQTKDKRSGRGLLEFSHVGTSIVVQSGSMRGGIGQGTTPTKIHLSECCDFTDPLVQIEEGLFKAVHSSPEIFMVLESTGNGNTGWWAEQWRNNKEFYWQGRARLLPLFLPWYMTPELYPTVHWIRKFPMPESWKPASETVAMTAKCEAYARNTEMIQRILGKDWTLPVEQKWFWEFNYQESKRRRTEKSWLRQMPCVTGDTLVSTERGIMPIANTRGVRKCESGHVTRLIPRGPKPIWKMTTDDGRILRGTKDHLVHLFNGQWKSMGDLVAGDAIKLSVPMFSETHYFQRWNDTPIFQSGRIIDAEMARLLGYFMGDGSFHSQELTVACDAKDEDVVADVSSLIAKITGRAPRHQRVGNMVRVRSSYQYWLPFLRSIGAIHPVIHSKEKRPDGMRRNICVPECIFRSPKNIVREFLRALFECDGHAYTKRPRVVLYSAYDSFLSEVQLLLLGFGIKAQFMKLKKISGASVKGGKRHEYTGRELVIRSAWVNQFYELIGFAGHRKHTSGIRRASEKYADATLVDTVQSVLETGETEDVFDISVVGSHRFGANGIEVHNCDDFEALTGENDSVFDWETINVIQERRKKTCDVYGLLGDGIAEKHDPAPADVDPKGKRIVVPWKTPGEVRLEWVMMPIAANPEEKTFNPLKRLLVYEHPRPDAFYSIGVDPGTGVGGDRTPIIVTETGRDEFPDIQVAEFACDDISNVEIYVWVAAIAAYYGQYMEDSQPRIVIEQRRKYGDSCYHALKLHGFRNHHKFREYDKRTLRPIESSNQREGWFTNAWSRPLLLSMFKYAVDNGWFQVNSRWLLEEIEGFEQKFTESGATRMDHMQGKHDDRIFAAAMSYFTLHDLDVMAERAKKKFNRATDEGYEIDYRPWTMTVENTGAEEFFEQFAEG